MASSPRSIAQLDFTPRGKVFPSPSEWRDVFMYQLMIDRFDNDKPPGPLYDSKTARHGHDPRQEGVFQGGKLRGITRRLDYLRGMGVTAIWVSPPFKQRKDSPGDYHGYAVQDFLSIDPRFGTPEDLQELVKQAHARGMYVILDIVINHTADIFTYDGDGDHPYRADKPYDFGKWHRVDPNAKDSDPLGPDDAIWPIELQDPDCFNRKGSIHDMGNASMDEYVDGDFFSLKDLNLANPKALSVLIAAYKYWIAAADIDGYRVDAVKHVPPQYASTFCNAIHEYAQRVGKHNFLIFAELVGDDALLEKYIGNNTAIVGEENEYPLFDACLDFPLYSVLDEVLRGEKNHEALWQRYAALRKHYRSTALSGRYYVTFVDNHDQSYRPYRRFLGGAGDGRLAALAGAFLLGNVGIPCLYYGTEQGFDGAGKSDHAIRETMFASNFGAFDTTGHEFFNAKHHIYKSIAGVAKVRADQPALRYGRQYFRQISGDGEHFGCPTVPRATMAFSRVLDSEEILVCLNLDPEPRNDWIEVDANLSPPGKGMIDLINGGEPHPIKQIGKLAAVQIPLEGRRFAILKLAAKK
ncbi:MAG TPA: alpha-amylase family glycosyl hydrolase [Tepidisphaeraceae bacterium]|nr:alpha-amylase family glycosyl hydrolase [Tepidisphaeraceae bacterium]